MEIDLTLASANFLKVALMSTRRLVRLSMRRPTMSAPGVAVMVSAPLASRLALRSVRCSNDSQPTLDIIITYRHHLARKANVSNDRACEVAYPGAKAGNLNRSAR